MKNKKYTFADLDNFNSIDDLPEDAIIVLDDRPRRFDPIKERFVSPNEEGYDDLEDIVF